MKSQLSIAVLFIMVILLPMIPASADNPAIDSSSGLTEFTWSGTASTVELVGEWNWDEVTTLSENSGTWSAGLALSEGIYCYKFIVDDEFIFDPTNPYRGYCDNVQNKIERVKDSTSPN